MRYLFNLVSVLPGLVVWSLYMIIGVYCNSKSVNSYFSNMIKDRSNISETEIAEIYKENIIADLCNETAVRYLQKLSAVIYLLIGVIILVIKMSWV